MVSIGLKPPTLRTRRNSIAKVVSTVSATSALPSRFSWVVTVSSLALSAVVSIHTSLVLDLHGLKAELVQFSERLRILLLAQFR